MKRATTSDDASALASTEWRYRRLVRRWYPASWLAENGEALIGTLLDAAERDGSSSPSMRARVDLAWRGTALRATTALDEEVRGLAASISSGVVLAYALVLVATSEAPENKAQEIGQDADRTNWGESWTGDVWVFTREDGVPLLPQFVTKRFESLVRRAELPVMTFHGLRHQHASLLIAQGVDLAVVSRRLGHSSIAITDDLYAHLLRDANLRAAESAEALVQGASAAVSPSGAHTLHTYGPDRSKTREDPAEDFLF